MTANRLTLAIAVAAASAMPQAARAIPPPVVQMVANCAAPVYASDRLVCATPELMELDDAMRSALRTTGTRATDPASSLVEDQASWFRRRSLCATRPGHVECLRDAYHERIMVLNGLAGVADPSGRAFGCQANGQLDKVSVVVGEDGSATITRATEVIAMGLWRFDARTWQPYIAIRLSGKRLSIVAADGSSATCRMQRDRR